ncbi:AAA family ATPase [Streptomyces pseudovenezuelae]|nr:AAA family ATPase [Streptomyces pseudovenezuelae]
MRRYVLTGTPGAGKTSILRWVADHGYEVVEEAATAVIARAQAQSEGEPWTRASFIDEVVELQKQRQLGASTAGPVQCSTGHPSAHARWLTIWGGRYPVR